jgi:hypothetical protein
MSLDLPRKLGVVGTRQLKLGEDHRMVNAHDGDHHEGDYASPTSRSNRAIEKR